MSRRPKHLGGCRCGAVRYRAFASPLWSAICHCQDCCRATGAEMVALFAMSDPAWRWTAARPSWYASSAGTSRGFCPACSTPICHKSTKWLGETWFYNGTLDDPGAIRPSFHLNRTGSPADLTGLAALPDGVLPFSST